jgi:hypothetical protein
VSPTLFFFHHNWLSEVHISHIPFLISRHMSQIPDSLHISIFDRCHELSFSLSSHHKPRKSDCHLTQNQRPWILMT